jgi:hypothetical protein
VETSIPSCFSAAYLETPACRDGVQLVPQLPGVRTPRNGGRAACIHSPVLLGGVVSESSLRYVPKDSPLAAASAQLSATSCGSLFAPSIVRCLAGAARWPIPCLRRGCEETFRRLADSSMGDSRLLPARPAPAPRCEWRIAWCSKNSRSPLGGGARARGDAARTAHCWPVIPYCSPLTLVSRIPDPRPILPRRALPRLY